MEPEVKELGTHGARMAVTGAASMRGRALAAGLTSALAAATILTTPVAVLASPPSISVTQCLPAAVCASNTRFGAGALLTIAGSGFASNAIVAAWIDKNGNGLLDTDEPMAQSTTDGSGAFSVSLLVANVAAGSYTIEAGTCADQSPTSTSPCRTVGAPTVGTASTPVVVDLSAEPYRVGSGSTITITGVGFSPSASLNVWFDTNSNSILDAGEPTASVVTAADGSFSTPIKVLGQPGSYLVGAGPSTSALAASAMDIGTCWFQDCFIDGRDTICIFGNSPTDFFTFFADCKAVDSNYTNTGYDLTNVGPVFVGAGALAAATNDILPPPTGCVAIVAAIALAGAYGNTVPDGGFDFTKPLTDLTDIACSPAPEVGAPPFDLTTYIAAEALIGHTVPDSGFLFSMIGLIQTAAAAAALAVLTAGVIGAVAGPVAVTAALTALLALIDPATAAAIAASVGAAVAAASVAAFATAPLLQLAILLAAQTALAEGAVAGDIACGYVDYQCRGSDITANILGHPALQQEEVPIPFIQPPFASAPTPNPCRAALGAPLMNGTCWGDIIGWAQVACTAMVALPDKVCEQAGPGTFPNLPIPGSAGVNNSGAPNKCATGKVVGLSIGYDGDVSFDVSPANDFSLTNYHNFQLGPGGTDAPGGIDIEIPLTDRATYLTQITALRKDMHVKVCGQWVADMHMLWNELHPITLLTLLIDVTGANVTAVEGSPFSGTVATFSDPNVAHTAGQFSASIDWGDGTTSSGTVTGAAGSFSVAGGHTFAEEGTRSVTVTVTDSNDSNDTGSATSTATVSDASLAVTAATLGPTEGLSATSIVGSFTDADPNGSATDYSAVITWGDGNSNPGVVTANRTGGFDVTGTKTYAEEGSYVTGLTVTDAGGSSAQAGGGAIVADAALSANGLSFNSTNPVTGVVALFTDADPNGTVSDYTATIDWGDGSAPSTGTVAAAASGSFTVSGSHAYAALGPHTIATRVCDLGGSCASAVTQVMVFAYSTGGSFAVGDTSVGPIGSSTGRSVYFWGAQWSRNNVLSGGSAPSSFKGFENNPVLPACGLQWTTSGGNSSGVPATVPTYMAVVVTGSVTNDHGDLSGDEVHVVIVRTDPGYGPQPGTPGTGTIVAVIC